MRNKRQSLRNVKMKLNITGGLQMIFKRYVSMERFDDFEWILFRKNL